MTRRELRTSVSDWRAHPKAPPPRVPMSERGSNLLAALWIIAGTAAAAWLAGLI